MKLLGKGIVSILAAACIVTGLPLLPVYAKDALDTEPMVTQETTQVETEESASEFIPAVLHSEADITRINEQYGVNFQDYSYDIQDMDDLVAALGADNVTVKSATEIKLVKDIDYSNTDWHWVNFNAGTYVIDFNGYTVSGVVSFGIYGGSVKCLDSSSEGTGGIQTANFIYEGEDGGSTSPFDVSGGALTVISGRYAAPAVAIYAISGSIRIEGGSIIGLKNGGGDSFSFAAIELFSGLKKAEILGGTFYADIYTIYCSNGTISDEGTSTQNPLKISGGTFDSDYRAIYYLHNNVSQTPDMNDIIADGCIIVPSAVEEASDESLWTTEKRVQVFKVTGAEGFVFRLYDKALDRTPDYKGYENWAQLLKNKQKTGSDVAFGFFFSPELTKRNLTNEEFITLLYNVFLDRNPDKAGLQNWLSALETGASRKYVFAGFANSQEWKGICEEYGIEAGSYTSDEPRDQNLKVTAFVQRLYALCLFRAPDVSGLNNWTAALNNKSQDGAHVAYGFFFSNEFINRDLTNDQYVVTLYQVLLGRAPDPTGKADWVKQLDNGTERMDIFRGFVHSQEFDQICADYGIVRGTI